MDFRRTVQRMLRIIWAYVAVGLILLIWLCVSLWSAFETSLRVTNDVFQNMFLRRRNTPFTEPDDGTSNDELHTSPKSANPPSDDTTSECTTSFPSVQPTSSDPTEIDNSAEKERDKQSKNDQISRKENIPNLEGLALQMAHLERHRVSTNLPRVTSPSELCVGRPNEPLPVNVPKSVLKSSSSGTKSPTSTRGTRRIRFQDPPIYAVSKGSSAVFTSPKKPVKCRTSCPELRKVSPAAYLRAGLNFQESPAKSSKTKTIITKKSTKALKPENDPLFNQSSSTASNQQLSGEKIDSLLEKSNIISSSFPSETADSEQIANKLMDNLSEESNSTLLSSETADSQQTANESKDSLSDELNYSTALTSEISSNQQPADESVGSLSDELNNTSPKALSTKTATYKQVSIESIDSSSKELNSARFTVLPSETATKQQINIKSTDFTSEKLNSSRPAKYKESEESSKVGDRCLEQEKVESPSKLKSDKRSLLKKPSKEIIKEQTASSSENKEYFTKGDKKDTCELPDNPEIVDDGESLQAMDSISESICQQSTEELINANLSKSSEELNPSVLKTNEEHLESEDHFKLESMESTMKSDHEKDWKILPKN